jgi:hypothetical protein
MDHFQKVNNWIRKLQKQQHEPMGAFKHVQEKVTSYILTTYILNHHTIHCSVYSRSYFLYHTFDRKPMFIFMCSSSKI